MSADRGLRVGSVLHTLEHADSRDVPAWTLADGAREGRHQRYPDGWVTLNVESWNGVEDRDWPLVVTRVGCGEHS